MTPGFEFELLASDSLGARVGRFTTPHGSIETPAFMPVGSRGSVKGVTPLQLRALGAQILLANAYHLTLRPGEDTVRALGGLHRFMGWDGPILTDSGGFQVFSLTELSTIEDDGVSFRSHVDGQVLRLTPEGALEAQAQLGPDIAMVLDHCGRGSMSREQARRALERTQCWAERSLAHRSQLHLHEPMALFGILQGGPFEDLRHQGAQALAVLPFDGFAVGGISVGEERRQLLETIPWSTRYLPIHRPRYLMGVGGFQEFTAAISAGIDLFDCVLPTRNARNGYIFLTSGAPLRIRNSRYQQSSEPLDPECDCETCAGFSRGFLHHLVLRRELLAYTLASIHNLRVFHRFLERAREAIRAGAWCRFAQRWSQGGDGS
ncbi:MAG: tRNA guanosine(34) transglycosylase Tgt [Planctomycetota bacterium]